MYDLDKSVSGRTEHLTDLAMNAYANHFYDVAAERLQKVVEWSSDDWNARLHLGLSYLKNHDYNQAYGAFMYICSNCPNSDLQQLSWDVLEVIKKRQESGK
jgi:Flp pilus assembly protein TadD